MTEHPIFFSSEMVRFILAGHKTQTRRVIKPQPIRNRIQVTKSGLWVSLDEAARFCPYGQPGDFLWVRETWGAVWPDDQEETPLRDCHIEYRADLPLGSTDYPGSWPAEEARGNDDAPKWRPSIFMPRWASRIALEITSVRVERVQDISEDDVKAEGISPHILAKVILSLSDNPPDPRWKFIELWNSINSKRGYSWASNPWVRAISFIVV